MNLAPVLSALNVSAAAQQHHGGEANLVLPDLASVSFLGMTGDAYNLSQGDAARVRIGHLWWKPGAPVNGGWDSSFLRGHAELVRDELRK